MTSLKDAPPLMFVSRKMLHSSAIEVIRARATAWLDGAEPFLLVEGMDVYQLIGGRWEPLSPVTVVDACPYQVFEVGT